MSSSWPDATSTMPVDQALVLNRPRRHMSVSSSPSAKTSEILAASASMSAPPQRRTDALTRCQLHPSSEARSLTGRPRPAWRVAQRPARAVNRSRGGAIAGSCSVTVPAEHPWRAHRHRRLCHTSRTGLPNAGRSTNSTGRSPLDHNGPPAAGLTPRSRRPPADMHPQRLALLVFDAEHLHVTESHQQLTDARRVALHRDPPVIRLPLSADSGGSLAFSRGPSTPSLHPQTRRARLARRGLRSRCVVRVEGAKLTVSTGPRDLHSYI